MAAKQPKDSKRTIEYAVIAGELKGKRVVVPDLGVTRPPLTRLRRSIFDFLNPYLEDAAYLDLFSGSGSYLFEAISRRASAAVGVELESELADAINRHARQFGVENRLSCRRADVFDEIQRLATGHTPFDIVMMAPPQYKGLVDRTLAAMVDNRVTSESSLIICQTDTSEVGDTDWSGFPVLQQRKYGNTTFTVLSGQPRR